jgi:hypothetical protein
MTGSSVSHSGVLSVCKTIARIVWAAATLGFGLWLRPADVQAPAGLLFLFNKFFLIMKFLTHVLYGAKHQFFTNNFSPGIPLAQRSSRLVLTV